MISSDATLMTNISGDKKAHCVYMSCGNIRKDVRSKASARCWMKVAEIPVATFNEISTQKGLSHRLYHLCMDIVTESLKQCSHAPVRMTDANGDERLVRTILFVHLADLPEQLVISCCHGGASPISYARHNDFGSGEKKPPRTGVGTVLAIRKLRVEGESVKYPSIRTCCREDRYDRCCQTVLARLEFRGSLQISCPRRPAPVAQVLRRAYHEVGEEAPW